MVSYGSRDHYTDGNIAIGCLRGSGYSGIISSAIVYEFDQKIIPPVTEPEDNRDTGGPTKNQIAKVTTDTTLYNVVPIMEKLTPDGSGLRGAAVKVHKAFQLAPNDVERIYKDLVPKGSDEDDSDDESGHGSFLLLEELDENGADLMKSFDSGNPGFDRFSMIDHLVRGITYAHQHGIFHGDIILANLMSTGQPDDWRIIDWDAAQEHPNLKGKDDLKNIINREIMTKELESSQVLDVLKDQLHLNVHAHPFLFAFVAQTLCKKAMRLTMDQVSYNMRYFSKQLPFLE
ncbi:Tyrosine kinase family catalytic domain protein [Penicillium capsulatum]|nr:Tyrosine kinase family catalytic domain protein [Penicillium capsulatum]